VDLSEWHRKYVESPLCSGHDADLTDVSHLLGSTADYGSYQVYANLSVVIDGVTSTSSYNRSLDFNTGLHTTVFKANDGNTYTSTVYCSYPDQVCIYNLSSSAELPQITISLENELAAKSLLNVTCGDQYVRLTGLTQVGPPTGMKYDGIARLITRTSTATCSKTTAGTLVIAASSHIRTFSVAIGANTNYDQSAGNAASDFSFKGVDPGAYVEAVTSAAAAKAESDIRQAHVADYQNLTGQFTLSLPDTASSAGLETSAIVNRYSSSGPGDPYLESVLFELGRHLFLSSTRDNSLPPGLQGRWSPGLTVSWGADYHSNINFQMNHWGVDQTGLGDLQEATWNYIQNTWVPRGTETAQLLYNAPGWVCHDEMNIFGHTGMKNSAQWANYPAAAAWMMQHVYDHYSYSQNETWFQDQGYPLMKGVSQFWLSQLQSDEYFKDGSLVVNPCNSPEHGPTTFACTHYQQLLHQLFSTTLSSSSVISNADEKFVANLTTALKTLDKGLHIGTWGEVKEWKLPDSFGYDFKNDTHRHLSNLIGWYPGYSVASFQSGYTSSSIQNAVATTLYSRGPGNGADANAGWEKVWRSACWARLNNTSEAYFELKYAIDQNFAGNGLSMYSGQKEPFQIDANFGLVGAVLSFLVVDQPLESGAEGRVVVLGPAIPTSWSPGEVKGLRLRGGGSVDFQWDATGSVTGAHTTGRTKSIKILNKAGKVLVQV
jgi:alpha-L-fucosidase 2